MSIVQVIEEYAGATGNWELNGERSYEKRFTVEMNDRDDGVLDIIGHGAIPNQGTAYSHGNTTDLGAILRNYSFEVDAQSPGLVWRVTANYSTSSTDPSQDPDNPQNPAAQSPLDLPAVWSVDFLARQTPIQTDLDGAVVATSAGQVYDDPPVLRDEFDPIIRVSKNKAIATLSLATVMDLVGTVNSSTFMGRGSGQVRLTAIRVTVAYFNGLAYFETEWEFSIHKEGWQESILNYGSVYLKTANDQATAITNIDDDGNVLKVLLASDGTKLAAGAAEVFRSYRVYDNRDFNSLNLGV